MNVPAYSAPVGKTPGSFGLTTDVNAVTAQVEALSEFANELPAPADLEELLAPLLTTGSVIDFRKNERVFPFIASGGWTVDVTDRIAGAVASVTLGASVTNPAEIDSAPFVIVPGHAFQAGKQHLVMFQVVADLRIIVTITPLS